jgi:beta-aspartyl-peptidase (threonine type)
VALAVYGPVRLGRPSVLVHGGAGSWRGVADPSAVLEAAREAARRGLGASTALDMVVEAVAAMEDSGLFNAGVGSVLNYEGYVEMDAGVMDSRGRAGAVAAVRYPRNPVRLARHVALSLYHVILAGPAADRLAERLGLPKHPGPTERSLERWRRAREELARGGGPAWARGIGDTVGAVAVASDGLAAAASTGGLLLKHPGRVGDSPVPGAGFYADEAAACAATGIGETILLSRPCLHAARLVAEGVPVAEAAAAAVARHTRLHGANTLGLILVDSEGNAAAATNSAAMPIAYASPASSTAAMLRARGEAER